MVIFHRKRRADEIQRAFADTDRRLASFFNAPVSPQFFDAPVFHSSATTLVRG